MITFKNRRSDRARTVLLIDARQWSAKALGSVLSSEGYQITHVENPSDALTYLAYATPDAIFVETQIHARSGLELCRVLRSHINVGPATPIFMTTSSAVRREERLAALRAGAWDLIVMPTDATELLLRLDAFVAARIEVLLAHERSLLDIETDLYSANGLLRKLRELSLEAARYRNPLACLLLASAAEDVASADARLERLMQQATRASDAVGRIGPAEYAIIATRTDSAHAYLLAQRLFRVAQGDSDDTDPLRLRVGCYAVEKFDEYLPANEILGRAASALRTAQTGSAAPSICMFDQTCG